MRTRQLLRMVLLAVVSWLATETVLTQVFAQVALDPVLKTQVIAILTVGLKGVDRWLHESGTAVKGLTRF